MGRGVGGGAVPPKAYFGAAGALGVVAVALALIFFTMGSPGQKAAARLAPPTTASGPIPSDYSSAPSSSVFSPIDSRSADTRPLSADEVFSTRTLTDPGTHIALQLTASQFTAQYANAVWGGSLAAALRRAGCTQAARGVYVDMKQTYAAFVTIFNLGDSSSADHLVAAIGPQGGMGFPEPPPGSPAGFGLGFGMARGLAMGHYAVITWVQRLTGGGNEQDPTLLSLLITAGRPDAVLSRVVAQDPASTPAPGPNPNIMPKARNAPKTPKP